MIKNVFRISLVIGIIILFLGASVLPSISGISENIINNEIVESNHKLSDCYIRVWWKWNETYHPSDCEWNITCFNKIQNAIDKASPSCLIRVYNGTYYENIIIDRPIKIIGNGSDVTIIDGDGVDNVVEITNIPTNNVFHFGGFEIINGGNSIENSGILISDSNNIKIYDNTINDNVNGIRCIGSNDIDIRNNSVYNIDLEGMVFRMCNDIDISHNNEIYDCDGQGVAFSEECYNIVIYNNTITKINKCGIHIIGYCNDVHIELNNISYSNKSGVRIRTFVGKNNIILGNDISNCGVEAIDIWDASVKIIYNQIYKNGYGHKEGSGIFIKSSTVIKDTHLIKRNNISNNKLGIWIAASYIEEGSLRENNIVNDDSELLLFRSGAFIGFIPFNWWGKQSFPNYWRNNPKYSSDLSFPFIMFFPWSDHEWDCTYPPENNY